MVRVVPGAVGLEKRPCLDGCLRFDQATLLDEEQELILFIAVSVCCQAYLLRDGESLLLPGKASTYQPGENAAAFLLQGVTEREIGEAFIWGLWVVDETQAKLDQAGPRPEGLVPRVGMGLV